MNKLKFLSLFFVLGLFIVSCSKDDSDGPEITITSPINNSIYNPGDTLFLRAEIIDDKKITSITISSDIILDETITIFDSDTKHNANYQIILPITTPPNTYDFTISAEDDEDNTKSESVSFVVQ